VVLLEAFQLVVEEEAATQVISEFELEKGDRMSKEEVATRDARHPVQVVH
jgi:hypothetical protein